MMTSAILRSAVVAVCALGTLRSVHAQNGDLFPTIPGEKVTRPRVTTAPATPPTPPVTPPVAETNPATAPTTIATPATPATAPVATTPPATSPATAPVATTAPATSTAPAAKIKFAPPTATEIAASDKLLMEIFGADISKSKTPAEKQAIAQKLMSAADEEKTPTIKYAMYARVRTLATENGDLEMLLSIVEKLDADFEVNAPKMALDSFAAVNRFITTVVYKQTAFSLSEKWAKRAASLERYDVARPLGDMCVNFSRGTGDPNDVKIASQLVTTIREGEAAFNEVKTALATLEKTPEDPAANLKVGTYKSYFRNDWSTGLKHLAICSNKAVADLAKLELAAPGAPEDKMKIADGWWEIAATLNAVSKAHVLAHAGSFYAQLVESSTGLSKAKVEKRVAESGYTAEAAGGDATAAANVNDPFPALIEKIPTQYLPTATAQADSIQSSNARLGLSQWVFRDSGFFTNGAPDVTVTAQYTGMRRVTLNRFVNGVQEPAQRYYAEFNYKLKTRGVIVDIRITTYKDIVGNDEAGLKVLKNLDAAGKGVRYALNMKIGSLSISPVYGASPQLIFTVSSSSGEFTVTPAK